MQYLIKIALVHVRNYLNFLYKKDYLLLKVIIQAKLLDLHLQDASLKNKSKCDASRGDQDPPSIPTYVIQIEPLYHSYVKNEYAGKGVSS